MTRILALAAFGAGCFRPTCVQHDDVDLSGTYVVADHYEVRSREDLSHLVGAEIVVSPEEDTLTVTYDAPDGTTYRVTYRITGEDWF